MWAALVVLATGAAPIFLPVHTQLELDDWAVELRRTGVPAQGYIFEQSISDRDRRTMHFRYQADGVTHQEGVGCWEVCPQPGVTVPIWYNADDPLDFVTDFGELSGDRGMAQGLLGVAGLVLVGVSVWLVFVARDQARLRGNLVVLVDPMFSFVDGKAARRARSSVAAIALLESLEGKHIRELWLYNGFAWPVVEWLQEKAYTGPRPDIGTVILSADEPGLTRALREWAYDVAVGPRGRELT